MGELHHGGGEGMDGPALCPGAVLCSSWSVPVGWPAVRLSVPRKGRGGRDMPPCLCCARGACPVPCCALVVHRAGHHKSCTLFFAQPKIKNRHAGVSYRGVSLYPSLVAGRNTGMMHLNGDDAYQKGLFSDAPYSPPAPACDPVFLLDFLHQYRHTQN
jgi:hypothetical protein